MDPSPAHDIVVSLIISTVDGFFNLQWGHTAVRAVEAWNAGVTGAGVRVCVLDAGFQLDHPDIKPNLNEDLSIDCTTNTTDCSGSAEYLGSTLASHGTHVASTIAAPRSKSPLVLQQTSIVFHPVHSQLSTHHLKTFALCCHIYCR
jgi:subtilisin family serine protease